MAAPKSKKKISFIETHQATNGRKTIQDSSQFVIQSLDSNNYAEDVLKYTEKSTEGCWLCKTQVIEHRMVANSVDRRSTVDHSSLGNDPPINGAEEIGLNILPS